MTKTVKVGQVSIGGNTPFALIAGPCVIENKTIVLDMASSLKKLACKLEIPFIFKTSYDNRWDVEVILNIFRIKNCNTIYPPKNKLTFSGFAKSIVAKLIALNAILPIKGFDHARLGD